MKNQKKDDGVSSVIGEMLVIALVIILISILAISAFNLLPGERIPVINVVMEYNSTNDTMSFWHKGGDWVDREELTASLTTSEVGEKIEHKFISVKDCNGDPSNVFDLGGCYMIDTSGIDPGKKYSVRLSTDKSVIYAEDGVNIS